MSKHTPGPWRLDDLNDCSVVDETYRSIAGGVGFFVTEGPYANQGFGLSGHISDADARLIAAAPEFLEALRELVSLEADGKQADEGAIEAWERARAVIAKATGSTHV